MSTTTATTSIEPTTPTLADRAHDADARLQKEQLALVATLLPKDGAIAEAEALGRAGQLDPAKVTLLAQLARPLDNTTLSLPLTERAVHNILAELIAGLDSEFYEHGQQIPYDEDKLGRLGGLGQAIYLMTQAKIQADMDWKHARAPMPQGGQYDPLVWQLLGLLTAAEPVGVLEKARGRYPAHQQVIDLLAPGSASPRPAPGQPLCPCGGHPAAGAIHRPLHAAALDQAQHGRAPRADAPGVRRRPPGLPLPDGPGHHLHLLVW